MTDIFEAILLGAIQGLTEFLPVSSTGHLVIAENLLGISEEEFGLGFDAAMHLGTLVAVCLYFRATLVVLAYRWLESVRQRKWDTSGESRLAWLLIVGTLPAGLAGFFIEGTAEDAFRSTELVAAMLILFSLPMVLAERLPSRQRSTADASLIDALVVGGAQVFALIPGVSRSGLTISTGMARGLAREQAATFAFLLSVPIIAAAGGKQVIDLMVDGEAASGAGLSVYIAGLVTAGVVGYGAVAVLMRYLRVNSLMPFVFYRCVLGVSLLAFLAL